MTTKMNIKETILEIENLSKLLKESYVFDDMEDQDSMPYGDDEMGKEQMLNDENETCNSSDTISQIRALALNGIQDFAENVESEEYQFYKKVWLLCDKFCESDKSNDNVE